MSQRIIWGILIIWDAIIVCLMPVLALYIRFDGDVAPQYMETLVRYFPLILCIFLSSFYLFKLYHRILKYAGIDEVFAIISAVTLASVVSGCVMYFSHSQLPRTIYLIMWFLDVVLMTLSRFVVRFWYYWRVGSQGIRKGVLIIGAGDAGAVIAREINQRYFRTKKIVGFIDDSNYKKNRVLFGVRVLGGREEIKKIVARQNVQEIIIAMPSVNSAVIREIAQICIETGCEVKTLPGVFELIDGKISIQQLRNIDVEDLLKREPLHLELQEIAAYLHGKVVLVTGAGGSIGSELCRQIAKMTPSRMILLGKGENSIYEINRELVHKHSQLNVEPIIADVRDSKRINDIFKAFKPDIVFHAAAHKHVPLMERQPEEAVKNNVFGTKTVAEAADRYSAERFILISSDKAVNPTSIMGATKRVAELIIQQLNSTSSTQFDAVRFGNVLGSRGSVIPIFKKQIASGGPVTITHPEMKRYFMTIPEAAQLVLQAGAIAKGGEVLVLDMGEPIKIIDMACDLIRLSGFIPYEDIKIQYIGLRPGEKLFEELLTAEEGTTITRHHKIFQANLKNVEKTILDSCLTNLLKGGGKDEIINQLKRLIPTYQPEQNDSVLE